MSKQIIEALCPVCGRTIHRIIVDKSSKSKKEGEKIKKYHKGEVVSGSILYLDYLAQKWDLNKDYWGIVREAIGGRNPDGSRKGRGFPIVGYLKTKKDNKEIFEKLKRQFLNGLAWWIEHNWFTKQEVIDFIQKI